MQKAIIPVLFCIAVILIAGCVGSQAPQQQTTTAPANTIPQTTTAAAIARPTVCHVEGSGVTVCLYTDTTANPIPADCRDIIAAAPQDKAFIDLLKKYAIIPLADSIFDNCRSPEILSINKFASLYTKPKSASLLSARSALESATFECIGETNSAAISRAGDYTRIFKVKMTEYRAEVEPCKAYLTSDQRESLLGITEATETRAGWVFTGTDGDMQIFHVDNPGMYIVSYKCTGESQILINIKDEYDSLAKDIESTQGQKTGKDSVRLQPGKYYLKVDTVGDWSVTIKPE